MVDGVINIKMEGNKRQIQISKIKGANCSRDWFTINLTDKGLVVHGNK